MGDDSPPVAMGRARSGHAVAGSLRPADNGHAGRSVDDATMTTPTGGAPATELASTTSPVATTASTIRPTTTPAPRRPLVIQGVGDVNLDPAYIPNLATHGYDYAFAALDGLFLDDDLTVINLECAPSNLGVALQKAFTFRCDPDALAVAREHGVDVANLANNHGLDFGLDALLDGRANLEAAGIAPVGVGTDLSDATAPALFEIDGWTVAVVGMNGVVPAEWWLATDDRAGMASGDDVDQMVDAVEAAAARADVVVVTIHWLWELEAEPRPDDRARAEAMVAAGADVVFGHHPHRLGAVELIDGRPVFWTLGNFVWPRLSDAGATTAVARVVVEPDGSIEACLIPAFITTSGQPELTGPAHCDADGA